MRLKTRLALPIVAGLLLAASPVALPAPAPRPAPTAARQAPVVTIDNPADGVSTQRIVTVRGTVSDTTVTEATIVYNGTSFPARVRDGMYSRNLVMSPGQNFIEVLAHNRFGTGKASLSLLSRVPRNDVAVVLWWDADLTDVDLWVTDPSGEKCYYSHRDTQIGGSLDVDVTDGYGPETFTCQKAIPGAWQIQAHYYGDSREPSQRRPIRVFARVILFEGTDREYRKDYALWLTREKDVVNVTTFNVFAF